MWSKEKREQVELCVTFVFETKLLQERVIMGTLETRKSIKMDNESQDDKKYEIMVESQEGKQQISIDEMIRYAGEFKKFQWIVGAMFCVMMIPSTFQVLIMEFGAMNSNWTCASNSTVCTEPGEFEPKNKLRCNMSRSDWEFVMPKEYSIVTYFDIYCKNEWVIEFSKSIVFLGSIVGSIILGWGADNYGRRVVLFVSMGGIILLGFINSFMTQLSMFLIFRFIVGVFVPGTNIQMSVLLSEMTGNRYRPLSGNLNWTFFPVALCILSLKAYLIRTWKLLFIVCTAPYVFVMIFVVFVPESVRWLRLHDKVDSLMLLFERIARWNRKQIPDQVTVSKPETPTHKRKSNPCDLFGSKYITLVTLNLAFGMFMHAMVYFGLSLAADGIGKGLSIYLSFFLISFIEIPAGLLSIYACHLSRKKPTIICVLVSGLACVLLAILPLSLSLPRIILAMIGKLCIALSFNTIGIWAMELYPTAIRGQGMGFLNIVARIGAASAPFIIAGLENVHESAHFSCFGVTALASAGTMVFLRETKGLPTMESLKSMDESSIPDEALLHDELI